MPDTINDWAVDITDSAKDYIDERNYTYNEFAWCRAGAIKDFVCLDDWEIQSQNEAWYPMWCVYFASSMHDNYCNFRDSIADRSTWWQLCDASDTRNPNEWDYIINWPKLLKKLELIEWYFQVWFGDLKEVLSKWMPVHVWSNTIDWSKTLWNINPPFSQNKNIAVIWSGSGHAFHIIWYNDTWEKKMVWSHEVPADVYICKNSNWNWDGWWFYIKQEDIENALYWSKFVFTNKLSDIDKYKQQIREWINIESAKDFYDRWYTNWERPNDPITRQEVWALLERILVKNNLL